MVCAAVQSAEILYDPFVTHCRHESQELHLSEVNLAKIHLAWRKLRRVSLRCDTQLADILRVCLVVALACNGTTFLHSILVTGTGGCLIQDNALV